MQRCSRRDPVARLRRSLPGGRRPAGVGCRALRRRFKDARVPMLLNVVAYWLIGFPLAYGFGVVLGQGVRAVWTGLIAGLVVCAVLLSWRYALITRRAVAARAV